MKIKKVLTMVALIATTQIVQAKDVKVVIKGHSGPVKGHTEVFVGGNIQCDTITVLPGKNITELHLTLKTLDGEVLLSESIPFDIPETFNIITPQLPEGFLLEIKDNNGVVYTGVEEEN